MPLTSFGFPFRENAVRRRFARLSHALEAIQLEISSESANLRSSAVRMTDCAAFAFEALDHGEDMSSRIDVLERNLAENRRRLDSLERQKTFVVGMRSRLEVFLSRCR